MKASRETRAQACDFKGDRLGSIPTRGNEIFHILISLVVGWFRDKARR